MKPTPLGWAVLLALVITILASLNTMLASKRRIDQLERDQMTNIKTLMSLHNGLARKVNTDLDEMRRLRNGELPGVVR